MTRDDAIRTLRQHEAELKSLGVQTLSLFGSTARGEARPDSDVNVFFGYEEGTIGLLELVGSMDAASGLLGGKTDIMPREGISRFVRANAERDAIRVF
jgi:predicted nucleotidyltransferase